MIQIAEQLTGRTIAHYQVKEQLGSGGMATVYRAVQPSLGREVALKILSFALVHQEGFAERFENEARTLARLDHPNILPIYDFGTEENITYIATPLIKAGTLKSIINAGPQHSAVAWRQLSQIGDALHHAHEVGVIHRDLKPSNVLIHSDGRLMLADFGLARGSGGPSGVTVAGFALGTPGYMAPEQAMGAAIDTRADIYALAVIAFELLTGTRPYTAESPHELVMATVHQPVPSACARNSALPLEVDMVLSRGLAKDPNQRPPTALQFVHDLTRALMHGYAAQMPPGQTPYPPPPPTGRAPFVPGPRTQTTNAYEAGMAAIPPPAAPPTAVPDTRAQPVAGAMNTPDPIYAGSSAVDTLDHMGVPRAKARGNTLLNSYYADVFHAATHVAGDYWMDLLRAAGHGEHIYANPREDDGRTMPAEDLARINEAFETVFGAHAAEHIRQWGRLSMELDIERNRSSQTLLRSLKLMIGHQRRLTGILNSFVKRLDEIRGEHLHAWKRIDANRFWIVLHSNPHSIGRRRSQKSCYFWTAGLDVLLRAAGLANDWVAEEIECGCVTGSGDCVFAVRTSKKKG
jgi:hypothetical protein